MGLLEQEAEAEVEVAALTEEEDDIDEVVAAAAADDDDKRRPRRRSDEEPSRRARGPGAPRPSLSELPSAPSSLCPASTAPTPAVDLEVILGVSHSDKGHSYFLIPMLGRIAVLFWAGPSLSRPSLPGGPVVAKYSSRKFRRRRP